MMAPPRLNTLHQLHQLHGLALRLRLRLRAAGAVRGLGAALVVAGVLALAWTAAATTIAARAAVRPAVPKAPHNIPALPAAPAAPLASADAGAMQLAAFRDVLGERRYVEQQIGTLFALAAKNGLVLAQGDYKSAVDANGGFATYQVNLPVKGSYAAIWQFAMAALAAMPYAALDDISFRRDSVGEAKVEARLRLTLYLREAP